MIEQISYKDKVVMSKNSNTIYTEPQKKVVYCIIL